VLEFGILGPLTVRRSEREIVVSGARRRALLIRLLISANHSVSADRLIEDLWEGHPPAGAPSTLQSHISFVRRVVGPDCVRRTDAGYQLVLGGGLLDAVRFEAEVAEAQQALSVGRLVAAGELLQTALARWRGPALADVSAAAWALPEANRLDELRLTAIETWHDVLLAAGRHHDAVASAESQVAEHPLREHLWAQLMLALYRCGRQAESLRAYQRIRTRLHEELGLEPTRELVALEEAIVQQRPELDWVEPEVRTADEPGGRQGPVYATAVPVPRELATPDIFVGRESELTMLQGVLKAARADGRPRVALVGGEPGIGKTTLAAVAARQAHEEGSLVLFGRCDQELGIPYQPWRVALAQLIDHAPRSLERLVPEDGGVLALLGLGGGGTTLPILKDIDCYVLFGALLKFLADITPPDGLCLVIDDIHGADAQSLQLLKRLASGQISVPALVIATYRDSEVQTGSILSQFLADLHRQGDVVRLGLHGLADLELMALLEGESGRDLGEGGTTLRDALLAETDGNPFFVRELLHHLAHTGALVDYTDGLPDADFLSKGLPTSLLEVIGDRVARLGSTVASVLSTAAVIGREFDLDVLAAALGLTLHEVLDELDPAIAQSLVEDLGRGRFAFTHGLIERVLYDRLGPTRRAFTHLQVATAIEEAGSDVLTRAPELARHWLAATIPRDQDKALLYAKGAADQALAHLAPHDARQWYERALSLVGERTTEDPRLRCELLIGLGDAERQCGAIEHREHLLTAAHMARELEEPDLLVRAALANTRGFFASTGTVDLERVEVLESTAKLTTGRRDEGRARVLALWAAELAFAEDQRHRWEIADEALAVAREVGDPATLLLVLNLRSTARTSDALDELLAETAEAVALSALVDNPVLSAFAAGWRYCAVWQRADRPEVERMWQIMDRSATEFGQPTLLWMVRFLGAHRATMAAEFEEAERLAEEALQLGADTGQPDAFNVYGSQVLRLARERDRAADFVPIVEGVIAENPKDATARAALARIHCDRGEDEQARRLIAPWVENDFGSIVRDVFWLNIVASVADTICDLEWREPVATLLALLEPYADQWDWTSPPSLGPVARPVAKLLSMAGQQQRSDELFARAVRSAEEAESPLYAAHAVLDWGRALSGSAGADAQARATELLTRAQTLAAEHGLHLVERLATQSLERLGA